MATKPKTVKKTIKAKKPAAKAITKPAAKVVVKKKAVTFPKVRVQTAEGWKRAMLLEKKK